MFNEQDKNKLNTNSAFFLRSNNTFTDFSLVRHMLSSLVCRKLAVKTKHKKQQLEYKQIC